MHKGRRLATTAGATVLTFVALGGVAQADPLGDVTGGLTDTLGGVVDSVTGGTVRLSTSSDSSNSADSTSRSSSTSTSTSRTKPTSTSESSGGEPLLSVGVNGPVRASTKVRANSSASTGTQADVSVDAGVRAPGASADLLSASVNVGVDTCGFAPEVCGMVPPPDNPPDAPPAVPPPGTGAPPAAPPGVTGPSGAGPSAPGAAASIPSTMEESLPITGGPIGTLALAGLAAVLTGSAAVGASRLRPRRDED